MNKFFFFLPTTKDVLYLPFKVIPAEEVQRFVSCWSGYKVSDLGLSRSFCLHM